MLYLCEYIFFSKQHLMAFRYLQRKFHFVQNSSTYQKNSSYCRLLTVCLFSVSQLSFPLNQTRLKMQLISSSSVCQRYYQTCYSSPLNFVLSTEFSFSVSMLTILFPIRWDSPTITDGISILRRLYLIPQYFLSERKNNDQSLNQFIKEKKMEYLPVNFPLCILLVLCMFFVIGHVHIYHRKI